MPELKSVDRIIAPSPTMCLTTRTVLRRFQDMFPSHLYESAVRTFILDDQISGEIEWTPVLSVKCIFAACDGGTRRLLDLIDRSSGAVNKGGWRKGIPACWRWRGTAEICRNLQIVQVSSRHIELVNSSAGRRNRNSFRKTQWQCRPHPFSEPVAQSAAPVLCRLLFEQSVLFA